MKSSRTRKIIDEWFFVSGVDVLASHETGGVVALGDSLTDGNLSTHDAYCRWPDQLARRLIARQGSRPLGVMNQGLGGTGSCTICAATAGCGGSIAMCWRSPV